MVLPFSKGQCHFINSYFYLLGMARQNFNVSFEVIPFSVIFSSFVFYRDAHFPEMENSKNCLQYFL